LSEDAFGSLVLLGRRHNAIRSPPGTCAMTCSLQTRFPEAGASAAAFGSQKARFPQKITALGLPPESP